MDDDIRLQRGQSLRKIRRGESEPFYERFLLDKLNIAKIKEVKTGT